MTYRIDAFLKFAEEDTYNDGCQPETGFNIDVNIRFREESINELIEKVMDYFGVTKEEIELNSCGEDGRIDICILENEEGFKANSEEIEEWKKGNKKLWNCIYTGYCEKTESVKIEVE